MKAHELPQEVQEQISHIKNWDTLLSDEVVTILEKLYRGEELTRTEQALDITPSELAALWSVTNKATIKPDHIRQVKREARIVPSREWGTGSGYRCFYRVRQVKDIKVSNSKGRPQGSRNKEKPAEPAL